MHNKILTGETLPVLKKNNWPFDQLFSNVRVKLLND